MRTIIIALLIVGSVFAEPRRQSLEAAWLLTPYSVTVHAKATATGLIPLPTPKKQGLPEYPMAMRLQGIEGLVSVRITIDEKGASEIVRVLRATRPEFLASVKEAVQKWAFGPAMQIDRAVSSELDYSFEFHLTE